MDSGFRSHRGMTNVKLFGNNFLRWACRGMEHDKMNSWKLLLHQHKKEFIELGITCPREVWGSWRQAETRVCLNDAGFLMCFDIKIQEPKLPWGVGALMGLFCPTLSVLWTFWLGSLTLQWKGCQWNVFVLFCFCSYPLPLCPLAAPCVPEHHLVPLTAGV